MKYSFNSSVNFFRVFSIAVGSIVGFGCFFLSGEWLQMAGPAGLVIGFLVASVMMLTIGYCVGYMASNLPVSGGIFAFTYYQYGRMHAFVCGWMLLLGYASIIAMNSTAIPFIIRFIFPRLLTAYPIYSVQGKEIFLGELLLSLIIIGTWFYINVQGIDFIGKIQSVMIFVLSLSVFFLVMGSVLKGQSIVQNLKPFFAPEKTIIGSILAILSVAPFAFVGFDIVPYTVSSLNLSPRKGQILILISILVGTIFYIAVSLATAMSSPWVQLITKNPTWATGAAMFIYFGTGGVILLTTGVCLSILTGVNGFLIAGSRLLYSLGRARMVHPSLGVLNSRNTPSRAIFIILLIVFPAPFFGRDAIGEIVKLSSIGVTTGFLYTCIISFILHREKRTIFPLFMTLLGCLFSILFLLILLIPGLPSSIGFFSLAVLGGWLIIGIFCIWRRWPYIKVINNKKMDSLILNK